MSIKSKQIAWQSLVAGTGLFISTTQISLADPFADCDVPRADASRYREVTIVSVNPKKVRALDSATRKPTDLRVPKNELIQSGAAIRDAYGLICLQKKDGSGHIWTFSSAVNYQCIEEDRSGLIATSSGAGSMGLGVGGCRDDEW